MDLGCAYHDFSKGLLRDSAVENGQFEVLRMNKSWFSTAARYYQEIPGGFFWIF